MRILPSALGALCLLVGGVWILQGVGVLPGSFMTGQIEWTVYGGITALAGAGLLWLARRRRP